jgi:hypothetical protein
VTVNEIDEIRWQMAQIRRDLHRDVSEVVGSAEKVFDWRSYLRDRPWLSVGAAFAVGYLIVPRKARPTQVVVAAAPDVNGVAGPLPLVSASGDDANLVAARSRPSVLRRVFNLVRPIAVQAAQSYASVWLEDLLLRNHPATRAARAPVPGNGAGAGAFNNPPRR